MATVDRGKKTARLNGENCIMRHFSQYVKPGAKRAMVSGAWGDQIAFVNPDGSIVMVIGNSMDRGLAARLCVAVCKDRDTLAVTLPAASINTLVIPR